MSTFTYIEQTTTFIPGYVIHNKQAFEIILKEMKKIKAGVLSFDVKVDQKHITDVVIRDNGRYTKT